MPLIPWTPEEERQERSDLLRREISALTISIRNLERERNAKADELVAIHGRDWRKI